MSLPKPVSNQIVPLLILLSAAGIFGLSELFVLNPLEAKAVSREINIDDYSEVCGWAQVAGAVDDKINEKMANEYMENATAPEGYWVRKWAKHEFYGAAQLTKRPAVEHLIEVRRNPKRHKDDPALENLADPKNYFYFKETIRNWNPRCVISSQSTVIRSNDPETGIPKRYWFEEDDYDETARRKLHRETEQNCHSNGIVEQHFSMTEHLDPESQKRVGTYDELTILYNENKLLNLEQPEDPLEWGGEIPTGEKLSWVKKEEEYFTPGVLAKETIRRENYSPPGIKQSMSVYETQYGIYQEQSYESHTRAETEEFYPSGRKRHYGLLESKNNGLEVEIYSHTKNSEWNENGVLTVSMEKTADHNPLSGDVVKEISRVVKHYPQTGKRQEESQVESRFTVIQGQKVTVYQLTKTKEWDLKGNLTQDLCLLTENSDAERPLRTNRSKISFDSETKQKVSDHRLDEFHPANGQPVSFTYHRTESSENAGDLSSNYQFIRNVYLPDGSKDLDNCCTTRKETDRTGYVVSEFDDCSLIRDLDTEFPNPCASPSPSPKKPK